MVEMIDWAVGDAPLAGAAFSGAGLAAAIGNFDGVHRGHQTVVAAAVVAARRDGLLPSVITNCRRQPSARKSRTGQWRIANGPINHLNHVYLLVFHSAALYRLTPFNINI